MGDGWRRTHLCGELREQHAGERVTLNGWVAKRRNLGGIYFLDVRDRYGLAQVVLDGSEAWDGAEGAEHLSPEDVVSVTGQVVLREQPNRELPTGLVEVRVETIRKLASSQLPPSRSSVISIRTSICACATGSSICAGRTCRRSSRTARASSGPCAARS